MSQIKYRASDNTWKNPKAIRTWDGSQWKQRVGYRWTGSKWEPIIQYDVYVIKDGNLSNNYTVYEYNSSSDSHHGPFNDTYTVESPTGGYIYLRTNQNVDLTKYSTFYVDFALNYGGTGGDYTFMIASPQPSSSITSYARIDGYSSEGVQRRTKSVSVSSLSGNFSVYFGCSSFSDGSIGLAIYNMWFE